MTLTPEQIIDRYMRARSGDADALAEIQANPHRRIPRAQQAASDAYYGDRARQRANRSEGQKARRNAVAEAVKKVAENVGGGE